jgi:transcriptional regulator with GAF, ATPase, and Fis domain
MTALSEPSSVADKCRILLQVSQAASGVLELAAAVEAVAGALKPFVAVDAVAVVSVEHDQLRLHAIHISGVERRRGESFADVAACGRAARGDRS